MIPLRDTVRPRTFPLVTYLLIGTNFAVFFHEMTLQFGPAAERFVYMWGLIPQHFTLDPIREWPAVVTSMFVHGGWSHIFGNMLYLHIFGDNVEDRLGHARYLLVYFGTGIAAALAQVGVDPHSALPIVGASGAIAGVTGAYFLLFPRARILTLVPIFVFLQVVEIPAVFFLLVWFVFQLMLGLGALGVPNGGGVAFWAHIGGFVAGMALAPFLARPRRPPPEMVW